MNHVLVIAEHNNQHLAYATRHAITAGQELGDVTLLIAGNELSSVVSEAQKIEGVYNIIVVEAEHYTHQLPEELSPLIVALADEFHYLMATASVFGKGLMPRVAAMLDVPQISDVIKVIDSHTFEHPVYAGNIIETIITESEKIVLTIRSTAFAAAIDGTSEASVEKREATTSNHLTTYVSANLTQSDRPALEQAKIVVSGGRALGSKENFEALIFPLADQLGAAVGASRAAVDSGFVPNDFQVGQTGKIVAPELYIALGISGAIQHVAGMQGSKVVVAINNDPDAQIFKIADYGLVGDLFELVPELTSKLS